MLTGFTLYQAISLAMGGGILVLLVKIVFSIGRIYQRFEDIAFRVQELENQVKLIDKTVTSLFDMWHAKTYPPQTGRPSF